MMVYYPSTLTMLGCGNMGGAMLDRWLADGLPRRAVTGVNRSGVEPRPGISTTTRMPSAPPEVLVVAVKPQQLAVAAARLSPEQRNEAEAWAETTFRRDFHGRSSVGAPGLDRDPCVFPPE